MAVSTHQAGDIRQQNVFHSTSQPIERLRPQDFSLTGELLVMTLDVLQMFPGDGDADPGYLSDLTTSCSSGFVMSSY